MQHQRETARNMVKITAKLLNGKEHFVAIHVSDDAASDRKARRILALSYPHMMFPECLAQQITLIVKDFLRISGGVVEMNTVQKVVTTIQGSNLHENRSFALKSGDRSHLSICSVLWVRRALFSLANAMPSS